MKKFLSSILALALVLSVFVGFAMTANAEETDYVAKIGDTYYETLEEAIKAVPKGTTETPTTITLLKDYTIGSVMVGHQYTQNIIIDLNGHTLSNNSIVLTSYRNGTTLTVQNGTIKGNASTGSLRATYGGKIVLGENLTIAGAGGSAVLVYVDNGSVEIAAKNGVAFTGGKLDFKQSTNVNNKVNVAASIGRTYFGTLADAIAAAKNEETISLMNDISVDADDLVNLDGYHTFFKVEGKTITIDLNGKKVYADASAVTDQFVVGVFSATNNGHLTLTGEGTVQGYSGATQEAAYLDPAKGNTDYNYKFYTLLANYDNDCSITVNGGNYVLDYAGDSLAYTSCNEGITVNDGTFTLGNLGGIRNGMPWVFNARGQNVRHVVVNGGSFCADIQHQYYPFEVEVPKELALKNENDMYTIVDAVAYVTEREWSSAWYTNNIGYATLEEAIAACEGPKTRSKKTSEQEVVVLLKDIELTDGLIIPANESVILDLNGKTISQTKECTESYQMIGNNGNLTINDSVGGGKIVLTDTGAGDPNFGWGTYTIRNSGNLVINNGTIELVRTQSGAHCGLAIFQYSGSTTINGGAIVNNTYRSVRLWHGDMTINGGDFQGQVWVHCVDDSAKLTITGGSFAPAGNDGSSVFVNNSGFEAELSITGGHFETRVGANDVNALAGCITGGDFTEVAKSGTNPVLFAENMKD